MNKRMLILIVIVLILIIGGIIMTSFFKKEKGENMKTYVFPEQVKFQTIKYDELAEIKYTTPEKLEFKVYDKPIYKGLFKTKKLIIKLELINNGEDLDLIVSPVGGDFPYGGTNPFSIKFSSSTQGLITYIGPTFPPEPPLPMKIFIPSNSRIIFYGEIPLDLYNWEGKPEVLMDWGFYYWEGAYPKGTIKITLPKK